MAYSTWSQDVFSKGELSPLMYARITLDAYFKSVKTALNAIAIPQGGLTKRFGTKHIFEVTGITDKDDVYIVAWQYLNEGTYILIFTDNTIKIYIDDFLVKTISSSGIYSEDFPKLDYTVLGNKFRIATDRFRPKDLTRSVYATHDAGAINTGTDEVTLADNSFYSANVVIPFYFQYVNGALPAATPALAFGTTYWALSTDTNKFKIYDTEANARTGGATGLVDLTGVLTNTMRCIFTYKHKIDTIDTGTNIITLLDPTENATIISCQFETSGTLPTSSPQVYTGRTYYLRTSTSTTGKLYPTPGDAAAQTNVITFSAIGTSNHLVLSSNWSLSDVEFDFMPVYDFDGGYDELTFTATAITGDTTITASQEFFQDKYAGGIYSDGTGIARIKSITSPTVAAVRVYETLSGLTPVNGWTCLIAEPVWSNERGWPSKVSSYQNRAIFANSHSLQNGLWLSAINDYNDFDDTGTDDDDAISWYPSSDEVNSINFIVPYRSLTIHTNSGVYSTPLASDVAITPKNFTLSVQDSTAASQIQPRAIDNQIIIISGDDVHSMLWDGNDGAYTSNILSVASEHLIDSPVDETPYIDINRAGSRYLFIVNSDGSLVMFQTLIKEEIAGFTKATLTQHYGNAYFRWLASNNSGRAWFLTERQIAGAGASTNFTVTITPPATKETVIDSTGSNFDTENSTAVLFTTTGTLPTSSPQIVSGTYYWVIGIDANSFYAYATKEDADNGVNAIEFSTSGSGTHSVEAWTLTTKFYVEELDFELYVDCATSYNSTATSSITGLSRFNAQEVLCNGDGYGFTNTVIGDAFTVEAHGEAVEVEVAQVGFGIDFEVQLLPLSVPGGSTKQSNVVFPKLIRSATLLFNNTVGGTVNDVEISLNQFDEVDFGVPPTPGAGAFEITPMKGWDDFNDVGIQINHYEPFDIVFLGIFYKLEI